MKRAFRLTKGSDFERVRRAGTSYAHPFVVLLSLPNDRGHSRFGVAAGRSVGRAVQRNRAKRLIRAALQPLIPSVEPGWDILILARRPLLEASSLEAREALRKLLGRAGLLRPGTTP